MSARVKLVVDIVVKLMFTTTSIRRRYYNKGKDYETKRFVVNVYIALDNQHL